jgi:hypothetical protein
VASIINVEAMPRVRPCPVIPMRIAGGRIFGLSCRIRGSRSSD